MQFTIKARLIMMSIGLVLVPLALSVFLTGQNSLSLANEALTESNRKALISIREQKKRQLESFLSTIEGQITTFASNSMIIGATDEFTYSFEDYIGEVNNDNASLRQFYQSEFAQKYETLSGESIDINAIFPLSDTNHSSLQSAYLADNPNSIDEKDLLPYAGDSSTYGKVHEAYHGSIRNYLQEFGFNDIYIVGYDNGDVYYSVKKKVDFATNLLNGPLADSGLAQAYKSAKQLQAGQIFTTSFSNYLPSYGASSAFISTPIYDGDLALGVLIFQMPIERITTIMTDDGKWQQVGLGRTGETFLVGGDGTLRSERRLLVEQKSAFVAQIKASSGSDIGRQVDIRNSGVGLVKINNPYLKQAFANKDGYGDFIDSQQKRVLTAYAPLAFGSENWAVVAQMDADEAFSSYHEIQDDLIWMSLLTVVVFLAAGGSIGFLVSKRISDHVVRLSDVMDDISKGEGDLTARIDYDGENEFGDISRSFNEIIKNFHGLITKIRDTSQQILVESDVVNQGAKASQAAIHSQVDATRNTLTALEQFEASIGEVARNSSDSQLISEAVNKECLHSSQSALEATNDIKNLMSNLDQTSGVIDDLNTEVSDITSVLDVITSIADQTNLLALNAAIEAARAGEHGRGFSVVAEEVRNLALRTQESTVQIQEKLETLHKITKGVVNSMDIANKVASQSASKVTGLSVTLTGLSEKINEMEHNIESVATAIEQQSHTIAHINQNMLMIDEQSQHADKLAIENETAAGKLTRVSNDINQHISQFKLD